MKISTFTHDTTKIEDKLHRTAAVEVACARAFLSQTGINLGVNLGALSIVAILLWTSVPSRTLLPWLLVIGGLIAVIGMHWLRGLRRNTTGRLFDAPLSVATSKRVLDHAWRWAGLNGLAWGASALFIPYLDWEKQIVLNVMAAGLATGSAASMAASPKAARAFMVGIGAPYVAYYLFSFSLPHLLLALLSIILLQAMTMATRLAYDALIEGIEAQYTAHATAKAMSSAEQLWRELSETAEAVALFDDEHRLLLWNDAYAHLLGVHPYDLSRFLPWTEVWQLAGFRRLPEATALSLDRNATDVHKTWVEEIQHGSAWYRSTVRPMPNGHVAVSHVDITALKRRESELLTLQTQLEDTRDQALQASNAKSRFLANMSHELRTPLNAVIGFSDLMLHQMRKPDSPAGMPVHAQYAQTIHDSGHHLLAIVEDMLDLARIEAGKLKFVESEVDLCDLIRVAASLAIGRQVQNPPNIILDLPAVPVYALLDGRLTRQALINLIGNAVKFTKLGGRVWTTMRVDNEMGIEITVRDEGIGIPATLLDEVLKPFAQVEGHEARRFGGVGLGLPLAKQFIELQGGSLILESVHAAKSGDQGGTTARLTLPAERLVHKPEIAIQPTYRPLPEAFQERRLG